MMTLREHKLVVAEYTDEHLECALRVSKRFYQENPKSEWHKRRLDAVLIEMEKREAAKKGYDY